VSGAEGGPVTPGDPPVQPTIIDPPAQPVPGRQDPRPPPERPLVIERDDDADGNERGATAQTANRQRENEETQQ
jgi:hypothetical protein